MESFAAKVRYGSGPRFDPLLEEKGGWIVGEARGQDAEMAEAVIEALVEASQQISERDLNPFKEQIGEILPSNLERNFSGFLIRKDAISFKVDSGKLRARIASLKEKLLIGKFVGPKPTPQIMRLWLQSLNQDLKGSTLSFCMNVGKGYFFLEGNDQDALCNALILSPYKTKWGTCMLQSWVPGFNPDNPSNLPFPTWITLRNLPFEHHDQAMAITGILGEVIGIDTANDSARAPRFCVNLKVDKGWVTSIKLESEEEIVPPHEVIVEYDKLPLRCRACHSWKHKVRDCKGNQNNMRKGHAQPSHTRHFNPQDKGKNKIIDDEGFQQVRSRRNTRRNIFENTEEDLRRPAYEQRPMTRQPSEHLGRRQCVEPEIGEQIDIGAAATAAAPEKNTGELDMEVQWSGAAEEVGAASEVELPVRSAEARTATGGTDTNPPAEGSIRNDAGDLPNVVACFQATSEGDRAGSGGKINTTRLQAGGLEMPVRILTPASQVIYFEARGNEEARRRQGEKETDTPTAAGKEALRGHQLDGRVEVDGNQNTGEPDNKMKWSPIKRTGHKRTLEELEEGEVESTDEQEDDVDSGVEREDEEESGEELDEDLEEEAEEERHQRVESGSAREPGGGQLNTASGAQIKEGHSTIVSQYPNGLRTSGGEERMVEGARPHKVGRLTSSST